MQSRVLRATSGIKPLRSSGGSFSVVGGRWVDFAETAGDVLRRLRAHRRLSLRDVQTRSGGLFKPSTVASYERGARQISLERLFGLADVYEVAPERVVAAIAARLESERGEREPEEPIVLEDLGSESTRTR